MKTLKLAFAVMAIIAIFGFVGCGGDNGGGDPVLNGTVSITGTMQVGEDGSPNVATATITGSNGTVGKFTYSWTRTKDGEDAIPITTANGNTYTITEADINHTLGVVVTNEDITGEISGTAASKVAMKDSASRSFDDKKMFAYNGTDYFADIVDGRTGPRYQTLEQLDIVEQLTGAILAAYDGSGTATKVRFRNVFGPGNVKIHVENIEIPYNDPQTPDRWTMKFHIDYLTDEDLNPADLQEAIVNAVTDMSGMPIPTQYTQS